MLSSDLVTAQNVNVIPQPTVVNTKEDRWFVEDSVTVEVQDKRLYPAADILSSLISGCGLKTRVLTGAHGDIVLAVSAKSSAGSYDLVVSGDGVRIVGADYEGVVHALSSFWQMVSMEKLERNGKAQLDKPNALSVPCVEVSDVPRYCWRGLMVDCSRHFFSTSEMKKILDLMAIYKLNRLHWHLSDDQGWRVEIKKYPLLTSKGAWRQLNSQDRWCQSEATKTGDDDLLLDSTHIRVEKGDTLYGGFYTQREIKEIVAYALDRGIEIVPEVDMPGHSLASISCYNWLGCGNGDQWDGFSSPLCLGSDKVLDFCRDVWKELFTLFPCRYVHIGGDEVAMSFWQKCGKCRKRMKSLGLADGHALQAWFTRSMERFFNENGRCMIGWDEVLAGGVSPSTTVMWWRGGNMQEIMDAAVNGCDVVCCPTTHFYFDYPENGGDVEKIYRFELPHTISAEAKNHVLGLQANIWTEHVPSFNRMMYMLFPRILAESEAAWTMPESKDWSSFSSRLSAHYALLESLGIKYRLPGITGVYDQNVFDGPTTARVACADTSAVIRYTTDGSVPDACSSIYSHPLQVDSTANFCFRAFGRGGKIGEPRFARFVPATFHDSVYVAEPKPGLDVSWYDYTGADCEGITDAPLNAVLAVGDVCIPDSVKGNIGLVIKGFLYVPADGIYGFVLSSDDGSFLKLDDEMVVDNDGEHSTVVKSAQVALRNGCHALEVRYFDHNGGNLELGVYDSDGNRLSPSTLFYRQ